MMAKKTSSALTPAAFMKAVSAGTAQPLYVFAGDDAPAREAALAHVRRVCIPEGQEDFALEIVHVSDTTTAQDVIMAAETCSFLGGMRVVWVRHAEEFSAADLDVLADYITETCSHGRDDLLCVLACDTLDKRTRFARAAATCGVIVECAVQALTDIPAYVAERYGKTIEREAVATLQLYVGDDSRIARAELEKVCLYVGDRETITREDVLTACVDSATQNEWKIADMLLRGNVGGAIRILEEMRRMKKDAMYAHAIVTTALLRLPAARQALADGTFYKRWGEFRVSYRDSTRTEVERYLRRLTPALLARTLGALMYAEIAVKATNFPSDIVTDICCASACAEENA